MTALPSRPWDTDRALRDRAYRPSLLVPDLGRYLREYAERSAHARSTFSWAELAYGSTAAERLFLFPAREDGAPLLVFVHGGYWQELSKEDSCFAALDFVPRDVAFAALGYGLAPGHDLDEIVAMVRRGVRWLHENAAALGVDPDRIFLSGSSAGAHLVAMCLLLMGDVISGATLLSGIYDLEPLRRTDVGEAIGLTPAQAARNSPIHHARGPFPPVIVARGGNETGAFVDQHDSFVATLRDLGGAVTDLVVGPRNHFDLPFDLGDPATPLGRATLTALSRRSRE
jgi:arylformamidase